MDPINGSASGDGSAANPWRSLQDVIDNDLVETQGWPSLPWSSGMSLVPKHTGAPVKGGDTIYLRDGDHGDFFVSGHYNTAPITLAAAPGHSPKFHQMTVRASANWVIQGVEVSNEFGSGAKTGRLIDLDSHGWHGPVRDITVENTFAYSASDSSNWSASDWNSFASNGIQVDGTNMTVRNNHFKNVNFGINVGASHSLIESNVVENFSGDGMRGLGDYSVFQFNTVKNAYDVNANHDDGFQSWSVGPGGVGTGVVRGVELRGNTFINYEDPNQPHRATLQGIGMFDGTFEEWIVENNVVVTDHWHGISLFGVNNSTIVNNTVVDINDQTPGPSWLNINDHKNGTPPVGNFIFNNLVTDLLIDNPSGNSIGNNIVISDPENWFVDFENFDLRLLEGVAAIDAGFADLAPTHDILGVARPQGAGVDVGAHEFFIVSLTGDADGDGDVDAFDLTAVNNHFGNTGTPGTVTGDADADGDVDAFDLTAVNNHFGNVSSLSAGGGGEAGAVPEPATVVFLGLGGLALLRRRVA